MGERLGRAGRNAAAKFLSALGSPVGFGRRLAQGFGRALRSAGLRLRRAFRWVAVAIWAFLGRCGLALRHLLTILLWRPLSFIGRAARRVGLAIWSFLGRCGLALRHLLTIIIWRPLLFVTTPLRWLYGKTLRRPVAFAMLSLRTFGEWLFLETLLPLVRDLPVLLLVIVQAMARVSGRLIARSANRLRAAWSVLQSRREDRRRRKVIASRRGRPRPTRCPYQSGRGAAAAQDDLDADASAVAHTHADAKPDAGHHRDRFVSRLAYT
jgi:hypothetical protein